MDSVSEQKPYLLSYRHDSVEEDYRLNSQHEVIKHAILEGNLIHPSVPRLKFDSAIADIGCGTGVWLDDVATTFFTGEQETSDQWPMLVGFDMNAHAFMPNPKPGVRLIEHDCTVAFDSEYLGRFDLVNIRGLAYAIPKDSFPHLVQNAIKLLKPSGYLQWLETKALLFKPYPDSLRISEALNAIQVERQERDLVPYLPHFMLQHLLSTNQAPGVSGPPLGEDAVTIHHFNLLPGGIARVPRLEETSLDEHFSDIVLESMKLLLKGSLIREMHQLGLAQVHSEEYNTSESRLKTLQSLMGFIDEIRKSGMIMMGGVFPQIIAQKHPQT